MDKSTTATVYRVSANSQNLQPIVPAVSTCYATAKKLAHDLLDMGYSVMLDKVTVVV